MPEIPSQLLVIAAGALLALWFSVERGLSLMMFFQQEEYDGPRFIVWLKEKRGFDKTTSLWLVAAVLTGVISQVLLSQTENSIALAGFSALIWPLSTLGFVAGILKSRAVRRYSKKPLVLTTRAKRILTVYSFLALGLFALVTLIALLAPKGSEYAIRFESDSGSIFDYIGFVQLSYDWQLVTTGLLLLVFVQTLPFLLVGANKFLEPFEERVKARFRDEALAKFAELKPKTIAITGSYGKTSTKHILAHILGAAAPTLATPGSINTEMGITRVIRESLTPEHQFFIVEMGAYGPGSIARLCRLTPPDIAMITALGPAHYERFKSLDTVARAKFELAEAVFLQGGTAIVYKDGMDEKLLAERMAAVPGNYNLVGKGGMLSLASTTMDKNGLTLQVSEAGETHTLKAPLFGYHQAGNILLAAACARELALPWAAIKGALASVPQIRFRLEVSKNAGQPTLINDAYNSNPVGFAAALECLDTLVEDGGRRILVTPGMVELGEKHDQEHEHLGGLAAKHADIIVVVTPSRIPTFMKGLEQNNDGSVTVMTFDKQETAEAWVKRNWKAGDAVLFENNLPDLYEAEFSF